MTHNLKQLGRMVVTILAIILALSLVYALWQAYVLAPWTRDARVSAHVTHIAPEVSGTVAQLQVEDNQLVQQGELLYRLDPSRFQLSVAQAQAALDEARLQLQQRHSEVQRRRGLEDILAKEEIQQAQHAAALAQASVQKATIQLQEAQLNLRRSEIRAPVTGYVTHLTLHQGDYAQAANPNLALIDQDSFWVTAYFEETKLKQVKHNSRAQIKLMGSDQILSGRVVSIGRGIADSNDHVNADGLANVNPNFSWIRLAQRIPVRIAFDAVPKDVVLAAGMTCSVDLANAKQHNSLQGRLIGWVQQWI
ncbi:efflux RND transporter periplasmic adaptor subunit [Acinetobacter larvae]|uniref:Efflux transporter periplasmic adaptor subunit n=1 Tax=Acinetobacter larvae TaxID=1789224 RepID=A0A1B2M0K3_9GAMM|nr:efflux RND transporter periplasmic adaptor subunit [Acinetobacter larvae]AOA58708.1 efflux transporter periplasmic adaptor subunit [Acinetobacter larvae]